MTTGLFLYRPNMLDRTFDDKGRVYQVVSPDTGTTTYGYDPAGNLTSKADAKGVTISYQYDALNRLTNINFPSDTAIVYIYDTCVNGKGRLCSMTDASGTTVYEYTAKAQVKKETKTIDSIQYVTQYTYDQNGNLKTMTYPSGRVITYNLSNDKVTSVLNGAANLATSLTYKPFGGLSSLTYGNGIVGSISYDNQYRVTSITAGTVLNLSYSQYDANGNIMAVNNVLDPTKNKSFTYDALDRLSTAAASGIWGSLAWTYDGVGNRLTEGANSYTYTANTNKLASANGLSYGFDSDGNTSAEGARSFTYNQNQRLIRVIDAGVTKGEYTYNGNGQRVKKVVSGTTTVFHYNLSGQLVAESNSAGLITSEYVYLNGNPLAKIAGTNTYFYHGDHLETPQKMTDNTGAVVWSADYKPFGEATVTVSTITNNLRFPGQYFDAETGLHLNWWRDYNPALDTYIEADRIGIRRGTNHLYTYAKSNPLLYIDTLGTIPSFGGGAFGTLVIVAGGASIEYEECCKGDTKYQRTLAKVVYGLGVGLEFKVGSGGPSGSVQVFGPEEGCKDYGWSYVEKISCFTASYYVGVDLCDQGTRGGKFDTYNANVGMGAAVYTVKMRTIILKEVAVGKCCKK
jgi:RHS repeat-associated protein